MGHFVDEGKIGGVGFSEISPASLRRAHAVHPVAAVQSEYSLWSRQPDLGLIDACAEIGAAFVAFSPLGRGVFGKTFPDRAGFPNGDIRTNQPRFLEPDYSANKQMIAPFKTFAQDHGWSPAALAIVWTLDRAPHIFSIPGTRSAAHLAELAEANTIRLTDIHRAEINRLLPAGFAQGDRYADAQYEGVERYC
jgi:aryl-alcohol dehydrogenase-like predicted oxidoreductase